jgi:hypothetical protein
MARALVVAVLLSVSSLLWPVAKAGGDAAPALPPGVPAAERTRIENVLAHATISTRVEIEPFPLRLDVFDYLLNHPDFATQVTRALKLARYRIWTGADGLNLDDGWGREGRHHPVLRGQGAARGLRAGALRAERASRHSRAGHHFRALRRE